MSVLVISGNMRFMIVHDARNWNGKKSKVADL